MLTMMNDFEIESFRSISITLREILSMCNTFQIESNRNKGKFESKIIEGRVLFLSESIGFI